jgi:hypothetical protein
MDWSWAAIKGSALSLEFLFFISCFGLLNKSYAPMKSLQLGARIVLCALPFGIICSIAARSVDAAGYGISVVPVGIFFILRGIIAREGSVRQRSARDEFES